MAQTFIDPDTDTVYVQRGKGDFTVVSQDADPVTVFSLPGGVIELIREDEIDTEDAYNDGYDSGYADGEGAGYSSDDLDDEYQRGYDDGYEAARAEDEDED